MESGFRRETFGPGEDRLNHGSPKPGEKKIFINNLINEGIDRKQEGDEPERKKRRSRERNAETESQDNQMTSKFVEVRHSLERDGLKQVNELDEEKSQEDNDAANGEGVKEVNIQIMGYERTESEEEVKPAKAKTKPKKAASKAKEKEKKKTGSKGKLREKGTKTGKNKGGRGSKAGSKVTKKRESGVRAKPEKKRGSKAGKNPKQTKKGDKVVDRKTQKETNTKLSKDGKQVTTVTTTTVTTTTTSGAKPSEKRKTGKRGEREAPEMGGEEREMKINGGQEREEEREEEREGERGGEIGGERGEIEGERGGEGGMERRRMGEGEGPMNEGNEVVKEQLGPVEEKVDENGNKVIIERIREGNKIIIITRTIIERVIMENGEIKKIREITEEREEREYHPKKETMGNEPETINMNEINNELVTQPKGTSQPENNGQPEIATETQITTKNENGESGEPRTIVTEMTVTETRKTKPGRRKSPPMVQKLLDQKQKPKDKKDSRRDSKKTLKPKKSDSRGSKDKKTEPTRKKKPETVTETKIIETRTTEIRKPVNGERKSRSPEKRKTTKKPTGSGEKLRVNQPNRESVDSDRKSSREKEPIELDKHKDKDIQKLQIAPDKKLLFNRDKFLQSSEENIDEALSKKEPKKPKLYRQGDTGTKSKRGPKSKNKKDKSRDTSRDKSEPKKSRSRPKRERKPKEGLTSSVEKEYRWKNHGERKDKPLGYHFKNPKQRTEKPKKTKSKTDPSDGKNYSLGVVAKPERRTKPISRPMNYDGIQSRYKLKEIKKPKMEGDKNTPTAGQLRRNRYKGPPLSETEKLPKIIRKMDSPFRNSQDRKPWKGGATTPQPFNFDHGKPEGYDNRIKFKKSPKSQSLEKPRMSPDQNPNIYKKINRILQKEPIGERDRFTTFQQPEQVKGSLPKGELTAQLDKQLSDSNLKKIITVDQDFFNDIEDVKKKIREKEYPQASQLLKDMLGRYEGRPQVEIYKLIAMLMFKTKEYPEAIKYITECLDVIADQKFPDKKRIQRGLIFNLIVVYIQLKKFPGALKLIGEMKDFPLHRNKVRGTC